MLEDGVNAVEVGGVHEGKADVDVGWPSLEGRVVLFSQGLDVGRVFGDDGEGGEGNLLQ